MDLRTVIALNMYDELEASGDRLDYEMLGKMIGIPMVPTISRTGWGIVCSSTQSYGYMSGKNLSYGIYTSITGRL